jgi:Zn2+/Cd2+-exporting ATPase
VVFLFLIGELLEGVAASRARASIQDLTKLVPKTALLEENGQSRAVQADTLVVGSMIQVRPGDRIPADGVIVSGESSIDEAPVTGESTPVRKGPRKASSPAPSTAMGPARARDGRRGGQHHRARRPAGRGGAGIQGAHRALHRPFLPVLHAGRRGGRLPGRVIPPLLFGGVWSEWVYKGLAILLIGCPCALVISTPAAIAASLSAGARRGTAAEGGRRPRADGQDHPRMLRQDRHADGRKARS